MIKRKPITLTIKEKVSYMIKNKQDISDVIKDYDIKGMNLTGAIIKNFNRYEDDFSNCNFNRAILGEKGLKNDMSSSIFKNCVFKRTQFLGKWIARNCDARGSNFIGAYIPYIDYQGTDLRNCTFCNTVFSFGTHCGKNAILDYSTVSALLKIYKGDFKIERVENDS